jgi:acetyltransferase AlgX (SGNH hydrolase-like protein)
MNEAPANTFRVEDARAAETEARPWRLSRLAAAALAAWMIVDVGLRFMPVEQLGVSAITAAQRFTGRHSPFRSQVSIVVPAGSPGENAVRGNLPPTERRPPLRFSTDALGYRRNPEVPTAAGPDVLFIGGDSFIYGANLSDEETLPAAFTRASGLYAYNGGRPYQAPMMLYDLDWLLTHLPRSPTKAVLVHLEEHRRSMKQMPRATPSVIDELRYGRWLISGWWNASPLSNATRRLFRRLADGKLLTNVYEQQVVAYPLPDGRSMLFRDSETFPARVPETEDEIRGTADYILAWTRELQARGMETYVLLLPTRFTVYGPFLGHDERREGALEAVQNFYRLEAELNRRGINAINGLRVFQGTAQQDLSSGDLPFYREDNHWGPAGVERIARILADSLSFRPDTAWGSAASRPTPERRPLTHVDALQ